MRERVLIHDSVTGSQSIEGAKGDGYRSGFGEVSGIRLPASRARCGTQRGPGRGGAALTDTD
jgi:hypothetical protein